MSGQGSAKDTPMTIQDIGPLHTCDHNERVYFHANDLHHNPLFMISIRSNGEACSLTLICAADQRIEQFACSVMQRAHRPYTTTNLFNTRSMHESRMYHTCQIPFVCHAPHCFGRRSLNVAPDERTGTAQKAFDDHKRHGVDGSH